MMVLNVDWLVAFTNKNFRFGHERRPTRYALPKSRASKLSPVKDSAK